MVTVTQSVAECRGVHQSKVEAFGSISESGDSLKVVRTKARREIFFCEVCSENDGCQKQQKSRHRPPRPVHISVKSHFSDKLSVCAHYLFCIALLKIMVLLLLSNRSFGSLKVCIEEDIWSVKSATRRKEHVSQLFQSTQ